MTRPATITFLLLLLFSGISKAQSLPDVQKTTTNGITGSGFAYPTTVLGEEHASFVLNYQISKQLEAEIQGFYDTYVFSDRLRLAGLLKWYRSQRLFLFSGLESEFELDTYGQPTRPPRIGLINGVGYQLRENILLEGRANHQINNSPVGAYGEYFVRMPQVYTVGGKVKF